MRTALTVVGFIVVVIVTSIAVIRVMAKYGHHMVSGSKVANQYISKGIKKLA